jgi:hypothetical protein
MSYEEEYNHFHVVAICTECADIQIIGLARDREALAEFFANVAKDLSKVAHNNPFGADIDFKVEIIVPNEILKIAPLDGHNHGHVSVCVVHKCIDTYEFCAEMQKTSAFKKMATAMTSKFMEILNNHGPKDKEVREDKGEDRRARSLLDSLDLPDDVFKGFN